MGWPGLLSLSQLGTDQLLSLPVVEKQENSGQWMPLTLCRLHHNLLQGLLEFHHGFVQRTHPLQQQNLNKQIILRAFLGFE